MADTIRILILEDLPTDYELVVRALGKARLRFEAKNASSKKEFVSLLASFVPDVIVSDYRLPGFDGIEALALAKELAPDTPFVIATGTISEEMAVECMKAGAFDYVLKDRLARIGQVVLNALETARVRREKALSDRRIARLNECFLNFKPDTDANIRRLVAAFGEMMGADCAFYNRLESGSICARADWRAPEGYARSDRAEGHICHDVIRRGGKEPLVVRDLPSTAYARTDPNVKRYGLLTYIGVPVHCGEACAGSLCAVYRRDVRLNEDDLRVAGIVGSAVGIEETRGRTERDYQTLFREMLDGFALHEIVTDAQGRPADYRFLAINPAFERMTGLSAAAITGRTVLEVLPHTEPFWIEKYGKVALTGEPAFFEHRSREMDKDFTVSAFRTAPGQFACLFVDITERKKAEEALAYKTMLLEAQSETCPDGILVVDRSSRCVFANRRFGELWGLPHEIRDDADDAKKLAYVTGLMKDPGEFRARVEYLYAHEDEKSREEIALADGRFFEWHSSPLVGADGKHFGRIWFFRDITRRRQAEQALRESEERLNLALQSAGAGVWSWDVVADRRSFDAQVCHLLGIDPASFTGAGDEFFRVMHPDDAQTVKAALALALGGSAPYEVEYRVIWPGGSVRHLCARGRLVRDAGGRPLLIHGIVWDITRSKEAEQALQEKERTLSTLVGNLPGFVYRCANDRAWTMIYVSEGCREITGYGPEDFIGNKTLPFNDIVREEYREEMWRKWQKVLSRREPFVEEYPITTAGGATRWVWERGQGVFAEDGALLYLEGFITDVTERRKAEDALAESERKYRLMVEQIPAITYTAMADEASTTVFISPQIERILGYAPAAFAADPGLWSACVHPDDRARVFAELGRCRETAARFIAEYRMRARDGRTVWVQDSGYYVLDSAGRPCMLQGVMMDITGRREAEESLRLAYEELKSAQSQLLQSAKMASVGVLAAGVAHEINNPSAYILTNLNVLKKYIGTIGAFCRELPRKVPAGDARRAVDELTEDLEIPAVLEDMPSLIAQTYDGVERIKKIVQDLRLFARPDTGTVEEVDINGCIEATLGIIRSEIKYKAELVKEYGDLPPVPCNPHQMSQVFMNILVNAAQAIEKFGKVTIRTYEDGGSVAVEIGDTGGGIPDDKLAKIFDPFYTTKPVGKGTGLGLSIVKGIVEKHGGTIRVTSEVGKGTTFTISLPAGTARR